MKLRVGRTLRQVPPGSAAPASPIPACTVAPAVTGTTSVGATLSCSTGTWTNTPTGYAYQWKRDGSPISVATSSTYVLVGADNGTMISCAVTATNANGSGSAGSNSVGPISATVPVNSVAPAITGDVIVGQRLFCSTGTWSGGPTSYAYQWYDANGAISGETSDNYVIYDTEVGLAIHCTVVATNVAGDSSPASTSNTAAVAAIDLSADAPVLTRTSSSGATPYASDAALGSKTYAGYYLQRQLGTTNAFSTLLYDGEIQLTEAMLQSPLTIDWTTATPAYSEPADSQFYERMRVIALSPAQVSYYSNWSNVISKTDTVQPVILNASDKTSGITLTNGALTATGGGSSIDGVRATRGISTGKGYWEVNVDLKAGGGFRIGAADSAQAFTSWWGDSSSDLHGFVWDNGGTIDGYPTYPSGGAWMTSDRLDFAADGTARKVWMRKNGGTWMPSGDPAAGTGGLSISGITGDILPGMQSQFSSTNSATFHFATASFVGTPPSGFSAI
jgi:hypothetical protein